MKKDSESLGTAERNGKICEKISGFGRLERTQFLVDYEPTVFIGYDTLKENAEVMAIISGNQFTDRVGRAKRL